GIDSVSDRSRLKRLFGAADHIEVERALAEFRSGRPVLIGHPDGVVLAMPVDGMDDVRLESFRSLSAPSAVELVVTSQRARALGLDVQGPVAFALGRNDVASTIAGLAANAGEERLLSHRLASPAAD